MRLDRSERLPREKVLPGETSDEYDERHRRAVEDKIQAISDDVGHFAGSPMYIDDGDSLPDATAELAGLVYHKRVEGQEDERWECYQNAAGTWGWRRLDNDALQSQLGDAAYMDQGAGNGLDSDTVDGLHAQEIEDAAVVRCPAVNTRAMVYQTVAQQPPVFLPPAPLVWGASAILDDASMWVVGTPTDLVVPTGMNRVHGSCRITVTKAVAQTSEIALSMRVNGAYAHGCPGNVVSVQQGQASDAICSIDSPWIDVAGGDIITFVVVALQFLNTIPGETWGAIECVSV